MSGRGGVAERGGLEFALQTPRHSERHSEQHTCRSNQRDTATHVEPESPPKDVWDRRHVHAQAGALESRGGACTHTRAPAYAPAADGGE